MMRILEQIAAGEVQALIVQELDRLARPEDAVIYDYIRQVIMKYGVIIHTHTRRVDLNNDDDDFVADITMSVAKKERRRMLKRSKRGRKARAESGKFAGGIAGLGYKIVGSGSNSDLVIDQEGAKLAKLIFDTLEETGGNLRGTAKYLNKQGFRGSLGKSFVANTVRRIAKRKLYIGIFESGATDKVTHRPDLQIITIDQFSRVQELIKSRSDKNKNAKGVRGRYIFTGFVVCATCGGSMVARNSQQEGVVYQCVNRRNYGNLVCSKSKSYSEHLILPPIVDFLAGFMFEQLTLFHSAINQAAAQFGKSVTEEALEAAIQGELESVRAGKQRLIEAISLGVLTVDEAAAKLTELREQEQRLTVEIATVAEKAAIMEAWQQALETVQGKDRAEIAAQLLLLAEHKPVAFRRLLSLVFEPNSLYVKTERIKGSLKWHGVLEGYQLTAAMRDLKQEAVFFGTNLGDRL